MASLQARRVIKELKAVDGNDKCFECGMSSPQWSSISYGILLCFNCAGKHRSLGTHLSVVRSLTMDKWNNASLSKLQVGGNRHAKEFFESQKDYQSNWSFQEKYNSRAAALLRDKIGCESEGKSWSAKSSKAKQCHPAFDFNTADQATENVDSNAFLSYYGGTTDDAQQSVPKLSEFGASRSRYEGFGNPEFQDEQQASQSNIDMQDILDGIVRSLSAGWSAVKKVAAIASENIKEMASQTKQKTSGSYGSNYPMNDEYDPYEVRTQRTGDNLCSEKTKRIDLHQQKGFGLSDKCVKVPSSKSQNLCEDDDENVDAFYDAVESKEPKATKQLVLSEKAQQIREPIKTDNSVLPPKDVNSTKVKKPKAMNAKKLKLKKITPVKKIDQVDVPTLPAEDVESPITEAEEPKPKKKEFDDDAWALLNDESDI